MADDVFNTSEGSGKVMSTATVTTLNGSTVSSRDIQRALLAVRSGAAAAKDLLLDRQADAASLAVALSTEDVALLTTLAALSKAEDAAHSSGDPGVMLLAVRQDTAAALAGTDGDYIPLIVDNTGRLHIAGLVAGEAHIGEVGGNSARITLAFTVSTSPAYSTGDVIGGKVTISGALRASGKSAILQDLHLFDAANQKPAGSLLFFNADPAAATTTDNSAFAYSTDTAKQIARVDIAASDWTTIDSKASLHIRNIGALLSAASGVDVYAVFVTTSTPTFAATNNLSGSVSVLRD